MALKHGVRKREDCIRVKSINVLPQSMLLENEEQLPLMKDRKDEKSRLRAACVTSGRPPLDTPVASNWSLKQYMDIAISQSLPQCAPFYWYLPLIISFIFIKLY